MTKCWSCSKTSRFDHGLKLSADINSIPRSDGDTIVITVSKVDDTALVSFYNAYPGLQALRKGYEVTFIVKNEQRSALIDTLLGEITLQFPLTPEEARRMNPDTLTVYKVDENGAVTKLEGAFDWATLTYTVVTDHLCRFYLAAGEASDQPWENHFADVTESDWFYGAVSFVCRYGFYKGTGPDTFAPHGLMSRAMFWTVLGRANGRRLSGDNAYDAARAWAMEAGLTDGTDPAGYITREQLVTMLWRYAGQPESSGDLSRFTDAESVSAYAVDAMTWAAENGILVGDNGALLPKSVATRAQAAAILQRFIDMILQ